MTACVYIKEKQQIILFYTGGASKEDFLAYLKEKLPRYMIPSEIINLATLPQTSNGKIDRVTLTDCYYFENRSK